MNTSAGEVKATVYAFPYLLFGLLAKALSWKAVVIPEGLRQEKHRYFPLTAREIIFSTGIVYFP